MAVYGLFDVFPPLPPATCSSACLRMLSLRVSMDRALFSAFVEGAAEESADGLITPLFIKNLITCLRIFGSDL